MPELPSPPDELADICSRYLRLYTGAIGDALDKLGCRSQILPYYITPFTVANRVAGPAFTGQGYPASRTTNDDTEARLAMLATVTPGSVAVWSCGGSIECAHWGEIMSMAVRQRGCTGAVVDGGVRDVDFINAMGYPVFARFKCAASSIGRWDIHECQVPVKIGNTVIEPEDFVFGDTDGVVVVPRELTLEILVTAEDTFERERGMREELRRGVSIKEAYAKYGAF